MKKHILKLGFALAVVVAAGYTVYSSQTSLKMTGIALNNVEALASGESDKKYDSVWKEEMEVWDEEAGIYKKMVTIICEGIGSLDC